MSLNPTETTVPTGEAKPTATATPSTEGAASTTPKATGSQLTGELLQEFVDGKRELAEFSPAQAKEFHHRFVNGKEQLPEKTLERPVIDPTPEQKAEEKKEDKPDGNWVPGDKYFQKATEANDYKQKFESVKRKQESLEEMVKAMQAQQSAKKPNQDLYSEEFLKGLADEVSSLKATIQKNLMTDMELIKEERRRLEMETVFNDLEGLQNRVSGLKTSKPFRELDKAYAAFQRDIGGPEARQKFLEDPEFRKQKEAQGFKFPMNKDDFERYAHIAEIHRFKAEGGYPTWSSAFADWQEKSGFKAVQPERAISADEQSAKKVVQKLAEKADESTLLPSTSSGSGVKSSSWSDEKAEAWMKSHPMPKTKEEKDTQAEIHAFLRNKYLGR